MVATTEVLLRHIRSALPPSSEFIMESMSKAMWWLGFAITGCLRNNRGETIKILWN